jgi:hypothetical protein
MACVAAKKKKKNYKEYKMQRQDVFFGGFRIASLKLRNFQSTPKILPGLLGLHLR